MHLFPFPYCFLLLLILPSSVRIWNGRQLEFCFASNPNLSHPDLRRFGDVCARGLAVLCAPCGQSRKHLQKSLCLGLNPFPQLPTSLPWLDTESGVTKWVILGPAVTVSEVWWGEPRTQLLSQDMCSCSEIWSHTWSPKEHVLTEVPPSHGAGGPTQHPQYVDTLTHCYSDPGLVSQKVTSQCQNN